jgi:hypothetical protein
MANKVSPNNKAADPVASKVAAAEKKGVRREIPGKLPYTMTPGRLGDALKALIEAERPPKFNEGFLDGVLGVRGGSARAIPPILKKVGMLSSDNAPTELYSRFKTNFNRPNAALQALRNGFGEIFRKNEYAHKLPDDRIRDLIVEITGLTKNDPVSTAIFGTFNAFKEFAAGASEEATTSAVSNTQGEMNDRKPDAHNRSSRDSNEGMKFNLVNTINIVLPETTDVQVYNAIFKSIKENLVQ